MSDVEVVRRPGITMSGIGITLQRTIGTDRTLAFELAVDATIDRADLDERLDLCTEAAERQQAIFELPRVKAQLARDRAKIKFQKTEKERHIAASAARAARVKPAARGSRPVDMTADENTVRQFDQRIEELEGAIAANLAGVEYLEAVIARKVDLPERFPVVVQDEC